MAKEKEFENKIKAFLKEQNAWFIKYWGGGQFTKAGVPDLLACVNGHFVAIEVKAPRGKPSELQLHNILEIRGAGGVAVVVYPDQFDELKGMIISLNESPSNHEKEFNRQTKFDRRKP